MSAPVIDDTSRERDAIQVISLLLGLELLLVASRVSAAIIFPVYDDAFIIFQHARNLAAGFGFVYHTSERVLGVTSPGFGVLLAPLYLLRLPMPGAVVALNILIDCVILWFVFRLLDGLSRRGAAVVFALGFAASPMLARICVGALETDLFLLSSLGAIVLYHRRHAALGVVLATGSVFVRPEAVLLVLVLLARSRRERPSAVLRLVLIALLVAVPPALFVYSYYGSVVPQSVVAKARFINSAFPQLIRTFLLPDLFSALVLPLAIWGGIRAARDGGVLATMTLWSSLYAASYLFARPYVYSWYGAPVHFASLLLASDALWDLSRRLDLEYRGHLFRPVVGVLAGAATVAAFWGSMLLILGPSPVTRFVFKPLSEYAPAHLSSASTIVATDIGAIGYYSNAHVLDTHGLVWPPALKFKEWPDIVNVYSADYLFVYATRDVVRILRDSPLLRTYRPIARFSKEGFRDLTLDPELYPAVAWTQDYILLERERAR